MSGDVRGAGDAGHPLARTLTPWRLGSLEVPHRVVMGSMHTGLEVVDDGGEALAAFWRERVEGGAALIVTGGLAVSPEGRGAADYAVLGEAASDARLAHAVAAVHAAGGLVSAQLFHAGRYALLGEAVPRGGAAGSGARRGDGVDVRSVKASVAGSGEAVTGESLRPVAPSAVPWRAARGVVPRELSDDEIWGVIGDFAAAARAAVRIGFDAVEIMASEGYLINQFCSPLTNLRDDAWGGDAERRRRFALEVLAAVRAAVNPVSIAPPPTETDVIESQVYPGEAVAHPDDSVSRSRGRGGGAHGVPVVVRVSGDDLMPGSSSADEVDELVRQLVAGGADAISVGVGWHESRVPTVQASVPHGAWLPIAERIAAVVRASERTAADGHPRAAADGRLRTAAAGHPRVAVIASNRMTDLRDAEQALLSGLIDAVALARPFLADPQLVARSRSGDFAAVNTCIGCNQACIDRSLIGARVSCLVNPRAGHESATPIALTRRRVRLAVVGAGPAGLAAAVDAARRGHDVTLFEAADHPGGQFGLAARIPGKEDYAATPRAALAELRMLGATLRFGHRVTGDDLLGPRPHGIESREAAQAPFDAVILATGVRPRSIDLAGAELPHVISYEQALQGGVAAGPVAIIGGGGIGVDVAAFLTEPAFEAERAIEFAARYELTPSLALVGAEVPQRTSPAGGGLAPGRLAPGGRVPGALAPGGRVRGALTPGDLAPGGTSPTDGTPPPAERLAPRGGDGVTVLRRSGRFGEGIGISSRWVAVGRLKDAGVRMLGGVSYERITPGSLDVIDADGVSRSIPAATVIVCAGQTSYDPLSAELAAAGVSFEVVGGALDARAVDAVRATSEGLAAARRLAP